MRQKGKLRAYHIYIYIDIILWCYCNNVNFLVVQSKFIMNHDSWFCMHCELWLYFILSSLKPNMIRISDERFCFFEICNFTSMFNDIHSWIVSIREKHRHNSQFIINENLQLGQFFHVLNKNGVLAIIIIVLTNLYYGWLRRTVGYRPQLR